TRLTRVQSDSGSPEAARAHRTDTIVVLQSFKHSDLRMPATFCVSSDQALIVRKDRGIVRPEDLKGKRKGSS
ncbi:MAG: hypothetical protein L7F78_11105, partial [Syntrophales bacterium LBB04]|nr:hypothetical protein [Syntrophales bacterium LBB04]